MLEAGWQRRLPAALLLRRWRVSARIPPAMHTNTCLFTTNDPQIETAPGAFENPDKGRLLREYQSRASRGLIMGD